MRIDFVGVFSLFLRVLSSREVRLGEEIAWYADGDTIVRSEQNHSIAYAYGMCPIPVPGFPGMDGSHFCLSKNYSYSYGCLVCDLMGSINFEVEMRVCSITRYYTASRMSNL